MRWSAPRSRAMAVIPDAPPAIIENAPVTGLTPGCRRSSWPAARLSPRVPTVISSTGSQCSPIAPRVSSWTSAPIVTPMTAWAAVIATRGTASRRRPPSARTRAATRPPKRVGEGTCSRASSRLTPTAPVTTAAQSSRSRRSLTRFTLLLRPGSPARDPAQLGDVRAERLPARLGQGQAGALPGGDRGLADGHVPRLLQLLDVLGQDRVAHPDGVADGGELHGVDGGEQPADLQPGRSVDDRVEPRLDGGHSPSRSSAM